MRYTDVMAATVQKLLRLPPDLFGQLADWAREDDRSVNSLIVHLLRRCVSERSRRAA